MSAALKWNLMTVEEYLAREENSSTKHEFFAGCVYAMAGGRTRHQRIATKCLVAMGARLRGKPCEPFNSDMKIRIQLPNEERFYYPDASVICRLNPEEDALFQDEPAVIFEVLSKSTRRIDEGEKKEAYLKIPSLHVYALVEQETAAIVAYRRTKDGFEREVHQGLDAVLPLQEVGIELPLAEVYDGIVFKPKRQKK